MTVYNFSTQYNTEQLIISYLQTIIIAQMLSIGGEGCSNEYTAFTVSFC